MLVQPLLLFQLLAQRAQLLLRPGADVADGLVGLLRLLQLHLQLGQVLLEAVQLDAHVLAPLLGCLERVVGAGGERQRLGEAMLLWVEGAAGGGAARPQLEVGCTPQCGPGPCAGRRTSPGAAKRDASP
jgi:hypothetical protein